MSYMYAYGMVLAILFLMYAHANMYVHWGDGHPNLHLYRCAHINIEWRRWTSHSVDMYVCLDMYTHICFNCRWSFPFCDTHIYVACKVGGDPINVCTWNEVLKACYTYM